MLDGWDLLWNKVGKRERQGKMEKIGHKWITVGVECWVPLCLLCYSVYFCAYLKFFIIRCFFEYVGKKVETWLFCSRPLYSWIHFIVYMIWVRLSLEPILGNWLFRKNTWKTAHDSVPLRCLGNRRWSRDDHVMYDVCIVNCVRWEDCKKTSKSIVYFGSRISLKSIIIPWTYWP